MKIPVHNPGASALFVGAIMVPPGETRLFEESEVPEHLKPEHLKAAEAKPEPSAVQKAVLEAAAKSLPGGEYHGREDYVVNGISGHFKADAEEVRKSLREALAAAEKEAAEQCQAALAELSAKKAAEVIAALPGLTDEDLGKLEALEKARGADGKKGTEPRKTVLEAIGALQLERAAAPAGGEGNDTSPE